MTVVKASNAFLYLLAADTKPTTYPTNTLAYEQDTGNIFTYNGSSWVLFRGASKTETYTNKTIDLESNSFANKLVGESYFNNGWKKIGAFIPGCAATDGHTTLGALAGVNLSVGSGSNLISNVDGTEGVYTPFKSAAANDKVGLLSSTSTNSLITRRAYNTSFQIRCAVDDVTSDRLYIGFTSNQTIPATDTPLASGDSGVLVGFSSSTANYSVFNNDGTGTMVTTTMGGGTAKAINTWHTFTITMSSSNVVCTLDGANTVTLTTRIPATATDLYLNAVLTV